MKAQSHDASFAIGLLILLTLIAIFLLAGCQRTDFDGYRGPMDPTDPNSPLIEVVRLSTTEFGVDGSQDNLSCYIEGWGGINADRLTTEQSPEAIKAVGAAVGAGVKTAITGD